MQKKTHLVAIPTFLQAFIYVTTLFLFKLFCQFRVFGLENVLPLRPGIIFASNHVSEWDGILIRVALPLFSKKFSPMYYVSRTREFYTDSGWRKILYGGFLFRLLGAYPAYGGKKNYQHSLQNFLAILKRGGNVCIFPEGIRSRDGKLGEAHGGVAFLAEETGAIVVPVAVKGLFRMTLFDFLLRRRTVEIAFGQPIEKEELLASGAAESSVYKNKAAFVLKKVSELL